MSEHEHCEFCGSSQCFIGGFRLTNIRTALPGPWVATVIGESGHSMDITASTREGLFDVFRKGFKIEEQS